MLKNGTWILMIPKCIDETHNSGGWVLSNTIFHLQRPSEVMLCGWKHELSINHKTRVAHTNGPVNPKTKVLVDFRVVQMMMFS